MTTPPVPQWAVDAAKDLHREQWHGLTYDSMLIQGALIIAAHAPKDAEDSARLDWFLMHVSGAEFRRLGILYSGGGVKEKRQLLDAAMKKDL